MGISHINMIDPEHWEHNGITGKGKKPLSAGTKKGKLLIFSSGACAWDDLKKADPDNFDAVMCINHAGQFYPGKFEHWVSIHSDWFRHWKFLTRAPNTNIIKGNEKTTISGYKGDFHGQSDKYGLSEESTLWQFDNCSGTSGLLAVLVGYCLGYEKIVLTGMPLDHSYHFFSGPIDLSRKFDIENNQEFCYKYNDDAILYCWKTFIPILKDKVRSMSGNTMEMFGKPTKEWLNVA